MKSKLVPNLLLAALLGTAALGAHAQEKTGFYVGAGVGQSFVDEGAYDDEDTAFSVFGGYQFHRNFALEAAYTDFGKTEPAGTDTELELSSASLTAVGIVPFTDKFSGYVKGGFQRWDLDASIPGLTGTLDDNGTDPVYGAGLQYRINDASAVRGEYVRSEVEDLDVDTAQIQARFAF